jgi:Rieske Fe-S protein
MMTQERGGDAGYEPRSGPTRRALLIGVGVAAATFLAGCATYRNGGGGGDPGAGGDGGDAGAGGGLGTDQTQPPLQTTDIPVGGGVVLDTREIVVTQPKAGQFKAFTAICTHQGCTVAEVRNGTINCGCHGSRFSATDGSVVNGPATRPLRSVTISVSGTTITLG